MELIRYRTGYQRLPGLTTSKISVGTFPYLVSSPSYYCLDQSKGEDYIDDNGIRTTVEYTINEEGKKIKVRRGCSLFDFMVVLILETDYKKDKADSAKITSRACRS